MQLPLRQCSFSQNNVAKYPKDDVASLKTLHFAQHARRYEWMQFRSQRNSHLENNLKDIAHSKHEAHISKDINMLRKRNQAYRTSNPSSIIQDETLFTSKDFS